MRLLTLDPSSICTGYAVMDSADCIIDAGLLKPVQASLPAVERAVGMAHDACVLLEEVNPNVVLIEMPDGKVSGLKRGAMAGVGLSVYGMAAGIVYDRVSCHLPGGCLLEYVAPNVWTGGKPKGQRARELCMRFRRLELAGDRGLDMADTIGMGVWWFERREAIARNALVVSG